jgi:hypothetical protein
MTINLAKQAALTHQRLLELLEYRDDGCFYWRQSRRSDRIGLRAGWVVKGYRCIIVDGIRYYEHRLAWFYITGTWPPEFLDHINLGKSDNRLLNLREATGSENQFNRNCPARNRAGLKGVSWDSARAKWRATITAHGKHHNLGRFDTPEQAHAVYVRAARDLHGEFVNVSP